MPEPEEVTRRSVLDLALKAGLAACAGGMAVPAALYLLPAGSRGPREALVSAGPADTFEPGTARVIQSDGRPILVLAVERDRFRAFSAICTHLGCVVKWDPATRRILCPCHAGVFGADGSVVSGPPPRPLPEYEVLRVGDEVKVKT
jgi:cytochrome b6-f complex iron-sulfur subunit